MRSNFEHGGPFKGPLQPMEVEVSGKKENYKFHTLKVAPDKVIRVEKPIDPNNIENEIRTLTVDRDRFYEMRDKYGINVPNMDFVIGSDDEGRRKTFIVVDRIEGSNIDVMANQHPEKVTQELLDKVDHFYAQYFQSLIDAFKEKKAFYNDIDLEQLMYGKRKDDKENKVYLADIEPQFFTEPTDLHFEGDLIYSAEMLAGYQVTRLANMFPEADFKASFEKMKELNALIHAKRNNRAR